MAHSAGDVPLNVELRVRDSANSAGVVIDAVRLVRDERLSGGSRRVCDEVLRLRSTTTIRAFIRQQTTGALAEK